MATPFENKDGLAWADQWDYNSGVTAAPHDKQQEQQHKQSKFTEKIKSAASTGMDKAKVAATSGAKAAATGAKKVKSGTTSGIQWIKDQYQKKTRK